MLGIDRPDPDRHAIDADPDPGKVMRIRPDLNPNPQHYMILILNRFVTAPFFYFCLDLFRNIWQIF